MISAFLASVVTFGAMVAGLPSTPTVVCVAGQCLQGFSNTTIGAKLSASGAPSSIQLLPGTFTSTTNPQFLHDLLTASSASLTPSAGFQNATKSTSLPLNLALSPGLAIYSDKLYSGQASFSQLPTTPASNSSTSIVASSLYMSSNIWIAVLSENKDRVIIWDTVPDTSHLPFIATGLSLLDIQSSGCSPACTSSGVCSASGTCTCPPGFSGSSCESCASNFFGSTCQPCPSGCSKCDDGITGSGRCLTQAVTNAPETCNCLNGACTSNGQCSCNFGWTTSTNGTACAKCNSGFFLTSTGDCRACQIGCTQCADGTGACTACKSGFTQNQSDQTRCDPVTQATNTGTVCPQGSFGNGAQCSVCSSSCQTCSGPTSNDCIICASGSYLSGGNCLRADGNGVCQGTALIADNNKRECDTCPAKCTACRIPNFNAASTVNQLQCTGCLPGFVLSQGQCLSACPTGTFISPQDNLTCTACDSSCSTCVDSASFCLTCASSSQLAASGRCVSSCPTGTFSNSAGGGGGSCLPCHPDCATCSGASFNQCTACPAARPVLINGRCLPTCNRAQYFDTATQQCSACDGSCSSCSGPGRSSCLACSSSGQVLRQGECVSAGCDRVLSGLGVCLAELVRTPSSTEGALPTISGLTSPTAGRPRLEWWQILLMTLGCAFIFLVVVLCWRRRARKGRQARTRRWAEGKMGGWWRLRLFRVFGGNAGAAKAGDAENGSENGKKLMKGPGSQYSRHELDELDQLVDPYDYTKASHRTSSSLSDYPTFADTRWPSRASPSARLSAGRSLYSEMTGERPQAPEPRQPVKELLTSRFSTTTHGSLSRSGSSSASAYSVRTHSPVPPMPTDAEFYAMKIRPGLARSPVLEAGIDSRKSWSATSKNPFRT